MKKSTFLPLGILFLLLFSFQNPSAAQLLTEIPQVDGYTPDHKIVVVDDYKQVEGMIRVGEAFSKARGTFSYSLAFGIYPSMNSVHERALRKLKAEASMRGASHIYVKSVAHNGGFGRFVSYVATFYRAEAIPVAKAKELIAGNEFLVMNTATFNRNRYKPKVKAQDLLRVQSAFQNTEEKDGRLFTMGMLGERTNEKAAKSYLRGVDAQIEGGPDEYFYEVIGVSDDFILVAETERRGRKYKMHVLNRVK
ncbi:hypothetical protein A3SI_01106 [Nitritalea halalkaliphila LW7]|uniref:Uncharacterized protein n=1 Tax=Nitritalea halalkaliphila LW7 TaxID=1189621 RepID=I5CA05_9BACT|nr:hypothetical protein [Nitritalea halalkaliphila]EIM78657.1 hypothetical protein A3SI_01106 [Nitritalea halalkaliphila LW7]